MTYPPVIIVDENDKEIGLAPLPEAWQKGLYHRIVSVFVQDDQGRMLLQLRSPEVKVYPNCWDQAAGGHVDEGQTYDLTARKELLEETGIANVGLAELGTFKSHREEGDRIINEFERVYLAKVPHDIELRPEVEEVSKLQWFTQIELNKEVDLHPDTFTPGLLYGLRTYFPTLLSK